MDTQGNPFTLETHSEAETDAAAREIFPLILSQEVILLIGELGAGKTYLARQFLRLWGIEEPITSPTFNLIHYFDVGDLRIVHADLYRLEQENELDDLDIYDDLLQPGPVLIEWGEKFPSLRRAATLEITMMITPSGGRRISVDRKKFSEAG